MCSCSAYESTIQEKKPICTTIIELLSWQKKTDSSAIYRLSRLYTEGVAFDDVKNDKILVHDAEIYAVLLIKQLTEEAAEARNKIFYAYRQRPTRKFSQKHVIYIYIKRT
ncbi:hypothetical protein CEXT_195731 [Caerostris extrusa]|uniref:Uncharacterized protein n=1 Tax=Caerostris extrusa TaxID=172846 RepID=A0AAV4P1G6_CAEEX|nr:hypothetical protein CEXT_195731 [Caerostris extrusa]